MRSVVSYLSVKLAIVGAAYTVYLLNPRQDNT